MERLVAETTTQTQKQTMPVASQATNLARVYDNDENPHKEGISWLSIPLLLLLGLAVFIGWAAFFEIDQSVRTMGKIIPSARTQIIQAADGGVLEELLVHEGEAVTKGQRLAVLEKERASATYQGSRSRVASFNAALIRARAETLNEKPAYGDEFSDYPGFVSVQKALYQQNLKSLNDELETLRISQVMANEELTMNENLLKTGDASKLEIMRARRQVSEINGKISAVKNTYLQTAHKEITRLEAELDSARYKLEESKSILGHTDIIAPVTGVVKYLKLNTLGGVLRAGDELMQISPTTGRLVVEAKINPVDIGQLRLDMPVSIKLDAFDSSIYGSLEGTLSYLSSDTLTEQSGEAVNTYYMAWHK